MSDTMKAWPCVPGGGTSRELEEPGLFLLWGFEDQVVAIGEESKRKQQRSGQSSNDFEHAGGVFPIRFRSWNEEIL